MDYKNVAGKYDIAFSRRGWDGNLPNQSQWKLYASVTVSRQEKAATLRSHLWLI